MKVGIYAGNLKSGGGQRHLKELLSHCPEGIDIHVYGGKNISHLVSNQQIHIRYLNELDKNNIKRNLWVKKSLVSLLTDDCIDILFDPSGTYTGDFRPFVSMSRNMLVFDGKERSRFPFFSWERLRLKLLEKVQTKSFRKSSGVIFISNYAKDVVTKLIKLKVRSKVINHGISKAFLLEPRLQEPISAYSSDRPFQLLYVSPFNVYKHQENLIVAVGELVDQGYPISLNLVGGIGDKGSYRRSKGAYHSQSELAKIHLKFSGAMDSSEIVRHYHNHDVFVYASTCENMPNILIEAMHAGLPILSSSFSPMPEFLPIEGALYFNPVNINSIKENIIKIIESPQLRASISAHSFKLSKKYSWKLCASETFDFLEEVYLSFEKTERLNSTLK